MANIYYTEPRELTIREFKALTGWSMAKIATELRQNERTLYKIQQNDQKESPHYSLIRQHLALIYKVNSQ